MQTSTQLSEIIVNDIVVTGTVKDFKSQSNKNKTQAGEILNGEENESFEKLHERLFAHIKNLSERTLNVTADDSKKNPNLLVRLITNEFFFFTKKPLTLAEFQKVMQSVADMAKAFPHSLHLILGSFAVLREDNVVMNVTPHIQCGKDPKINLIVKNYPSVMDPIYSKEQDQLPNATKDIPEKEVLSTQVDVSDSAIKIDDKVHHFSFNNIILCEPKESNPFFSCIEVCKDHGLKVAKTNLFNYYSTLFDKDNDAKNNKVQELDSQVKQTFLINHVVISNSISIIPENCLSDKVTHADPRFLECPQASLTLEDKEDFVGDVKFGTSFSIRPKEPLFVSHVGNELFQHFLLYNRRCVIPFLDKMKEKKDFNVNIKDKSGYTPIITALLLNDVDLVKKLIKEFNADSKAAFEFCLKRKNLPMFQIGLQFPEFRNIVDLHVLAKTGSKAMLFEALAAGVEYKEDIRNLESIEIEDSRDLILRCTRMKELVKSMAPFELRGAKKEDELKRFFLGDGNLTLFKPALLDKEEMVLEGLLGTKPEFIIKETIKRELMEQTPDERFLIKLFYLQDNLPRIISPVVDNVLKNSLPPPAWHNPSDNPKK